MALPSGTHRATVGATGTDFAVNTAAGAKFSVGQLADQDGHIVGSLPAYGFVVPPAAVAANKVYFDLFNAQAGARLRLRKLFAIPQADTAVTGALSVRLDFMRTSTVGTGGTASATPPSAAKAAAAIWPFAPDAPVLPVGITMRMAPTGGATDREWLFPAYVFTEETAPGTHLAPMFNLLPELPADQAIELPQGYGLKIVQGAVASVGSIGFLGAFVLEQ